MTVSLWDLTTGTRVELENGVIAEILAPTEDGNWVKVKYIRAPQDPDIVGTEDLCSSDEIQRIES